VWSACEIYAKIASRSRLQWTVCRHAGNYGAPARDVARTNNNNNNNMMMMIHIIHICVSRSVGIHSAVSINYEKKRRPRHSTIATVLSRRVLHFQYKCFLYYYYYYYNTRRQFLERLSVRFITTVVCVRSKDILSFASHPFPRSTRFFTRPKFASSETASETTRPGHANDER